MYPKKEISLEKNNQAKSVKKIQQTDLKRKASLIVSSKYCTQSAFHNLNCPVLFSQTSIKFNLKSNQVL
jgi:hypothetical protein